jgi:CDP-diglyceride synthetase
LRLVEIDEAVDHGLARQHLHLRIERGAHREPALVKLLLAVILEDVAAHLLGEIFGGESVGAGRPHGDVSGFFGLSPAAAVM